MIVEGRLSKGDTVTVEARRGEVALRIARKSPKVA